MQVLEGECDRMWIPSFDMTHMHTAGLPSGHTADRLLTRARMHDTGLSTYALAYRLRSSVQSLVGMHEANLCRFSA